MKQTILSIALILMASLAVACGAPASGNADQPPAATLRSLPLASPTTMPTEVPAESFLSAPDVAVVKLLTDLKGAGAKPLFQWEAIPAADRYQLIVFDEAGDPYWAWEGTQTQIYMGGTQSQPPDDSSGPSIGSGYTWAVMAYSSDGKLLAVSEVRKISP
jgi:hypothetical protein